MGFKPVIVRVKYNFNDLAKAQKKNENGMLEDRLWRDYEFKAPIAKPKTGFLKISSIKKLTDPKMVGCDLNGEDWYVPLYMHVPLYMREKDSDDYLTLALELDPPVKRGSWRIAISSKPDEPEDVPDQPADRPADLQYEVLRPYPDQKDEVSHFLLPVRFRLNSVTNLPGLTPGWNNTAGTQFLHIHSPENTRTIRLFRYDPVMYKKDYQRILNKINLLGWELLEARNTERSASVGQWDDLKDLVDKMQDVLHQINNMPERELVGGRDRVPAYRIKKLTPRAVVDRAVGKQKLLTGIHKESADLYEHRMIRAHLENWKKRADRFQAWEKEEEQRLFRAGEDTPSPQTVKRTDASRNTREAKAKHILREMECDWAGISQQIDQMLELPLLRDVDLRAGEYLHTSNLFAGHRNYQQAYSLMREKPILLTDIFRWESGTYQAGPIHRIYEIWCLLKILCILVNDYRFTLEPFPEEPLPEEPPLDKLRKSLREHIRTNGDKEVPAIHLKKKDGVLKDMALKLDYDKKIELKEGTRFSYLRPDFHLSIQYKNKEYHFCFDAKYHNYAQEHQTDGEWYRDLFDVAWYKYIHRLNRSQEDFKIDGSYILHVDSRTGSVFDDDQSMSVGRYFWSRHSQRKEALLDGWRKNSLEFGSKKRGDPDNFLKELAELEDYRIGTFCFTPFSDDTADSPFRRLMQMIMERFVGMDFPEVHQKCWLCGGEDLEINDGIEIKGGNPKYGRYKEYWVQAVCSKCWRPMGMIARDYAKDRFLSVLAGSPQ